MSKCRKTCYENQSGAVAAMISLYRNRKAEDGSLHTYICKQCGTWHVGHRKFRSRIKPTTWEVIKG